MKNLKRSSTKLLTGNVENTLQGILSLQIVKDSLLNQQVLAYMRNKDISITGARTKSCYPQRAPTIVKIDQMIYIVMTNTVEKANKSSIALIKVLDPSQID